VLTGGVLFWFVSPESMWTAYLFPLLAGFGFGAAYVCVPTITGNYWGPEAFAGITGVFSPIAMLIQSSAAPLAGFLYDLKGALPHFSEEVGHLASQSHIENQLKKINGNHYENRRKISSI
jgi:MFS family permease